MPDALTFLNGKKVKNKADWEKRKEEIKNLWCDYFIGHYPKEIPALLSANTVSSTKLKDGTSRKRIVLTFDTPNKKSFEIEVWEPSLHHKRSMPLFLTQPRIYQVQWAEEAVKRGYIACFYPGVDTHQKEEDYLGYESVWKVFKEEYPDASWCSSLGIQAWLASRTLDYFLDPASNYNIDTTSVGIAGFSRYGKQSIYAAAYDERFKCVVARSSGTPTACAYRFAGRQTFMETPSLEDCPKAWLADSIRNFYGRENEIPVEGNDLLATIAPRYLMLHTAYNDGSDPTFGVEQNYLNAKKAYRLLGKEENICLDYREGNHSPITKEHTIRVFDFFDMAFKRGTAKRNDFPERLIHNFNWEKWKAGLDKKELNPPLNGSAEDNINWMLGTIPENFEKQNVYQIKEGTDLPLGDAFRDRWNPGNIKRVPFAFAGNMQGDIFFDKTRESYKGTVIWLHPWNYSLGYSESYGVQGLPIYYRLAAEGYKVVAYDQFGFGNHLKYAINFYEKYPNWSLLGRAVSDVSSVINYLVEGKGIAREEVPETDPSKIYICGFSYGGMVGLYAAALDKRIAGVASFSGFTPMRTDTDQKPTGGIRRLWEWHHVLPKLGLFHNKEREIPYDYDDVLKMIAPRKVLVYAPLRDRFSDTDDIDVCVREAQKAWKDNVGFQYRKPDDICRFQKEQQDVLIDWLDQY